MRISVIEARDLSDAWFQCIWTVMDEGYEYTIDSGSFQGQRRKEVDFATVHIKHPGARPLVPITPANVPPPTTMEYVEDYLSYLMTGTKQKDEEYTYGEDIEHQLQPLIDMYKKGYETNQACMTIGSKHSIHMADPPCLRVIDTRVRYGQLHFMLYFRSWDLWAGFPSNLAALQLLKEHIA
ncbi:MAG: thymidylate synthase, partial [Chloroflexota bacterium]